MRAVVADDEELARRRLVRLIQSLGSIEVVGEATDGNDALAQVRSLQPDVLFLDVRMPELDGIELATRNVMLPSIVFTTAYDEFAVHAFEVEAVDYLLKPITAERLSVAVQRVRQSRLSTSVCIASAMRAAVDAPAASLPRVTAKSRGAIHLFDARQVTRFYALDKYTAFQVAGREHLTQESLGSLEERLQGYGFLRIHRAELVNLALVRVLHDTECGYELELSDGQRSRVSRRLSATLKEVLGIA